MADGNPYAQYRAAPANPYAAFTITSRRDPLAVKRDQRADDAAARSAAAADRAASASQRSAANEATRIAMEREKMDNDERGSTADPATVTYYAQQVLAGSPMPSMGMGKQAAATRQAIMQEVARLGGAAGMTGADQAAQIAHYKAGSSQITNLEKMAGTIGVNEQTAMANGQQFLDRSAELPGQTRFAPLNALSDAIQRRFGGTTISAADAAYNTFTNEYAKVVAGSPSGAGTLSDSARHEAMSTINGSGSLAQKQSAFDQMKRDMANRMVAIHGGITNAYKSLTAQPGYQVPDTTQALSVSTALGRGGNNQGGGDPSSGGAGGGGGGNGGGGPGGGRFGLATGATRRVNDPTRSPAVTALQALLRSNAPDSAIQAAAAGLGASPDSVAGALAFRSKYPDYKGPYDIDDLGKTDVPTTLGQRIAGSAPGAFVASAANAATAGIPARLAGNSGGMAAMEAAHPLASVVGDLTGAAVGAAGGEALLAKGAAKLGGGAIARLLANPVTADAAFGGLSGANSDPNADLGQSLENGVLGVAAGAAGSYAGRKVIAPLLAKSLAPVVPAINNTLDRLGVARALTTPVAPVPASASQVLATARRGGIDDIRSQLTSAASLGVPMTLADTTPGLRSLAGAAVRRSPNAAQVAEDALIPRSRGQIDRFQSAVARDLGPTANVPQLSADMTRQAQTAAAPLYDAAYANSVPHTPELEAVLNTPFGKQALGRARTIAANERRDPSELGFALDADGNTVLNPQPNAQIANHLSARDTLDEAQAAYRAARTEPNADMTKAVNRVEQARQGLREAQAALDAAPDPTAAASVPSYTQQTLDYVKRGMDDILEQQRNPITGKLQLDEAGRAQNGVRASLLSENDSLNPAFADARAAYAGPVQARDALARGQDAFSLTPDELGIQVAAQTSEHLEQMRLGNRSQLIQNAQNMRDATNPFDAASTLGTPAARARLDVLHGAAPDTNLARLYQQADMERGLARTTNKIIGNSDTAERTSADKAFGGGAGPALAIDAGTMALGGVPTASVARALTTGGVRDAMTLGLGKRAVARADDIAPLLLNTDPTASLSSLNDLVTNDDAYRAYINRQSVQRIAGLLGAGGGVNIAGALTQ